VTYTPTVAVKIAKGQVGYRESGENRTKFNNWLGVIPGYPHGGRGYPWCMSFQAWVAYKAGGKANAHYPRTAGCEVAVAWFKAHKRFSTRPHVGDLVFYGPGGGTHVELVVAVSKAAITTVGGNTSGSLKGTFHNGDGVYQKSVARSSSRIYGYGRPAYGAAASQEDDDMDPNTIVKVPAYWADKKRSKFSHPTYSAAFLWAGTLNEVRAYGSRIEAKLAAQQVTIDKLATAVATLSAGKQIDPKKLIQEIKDELAKVTVRLDADEADA
jgi:hypothetical protein